MRSHFLTNYKSKGILFYLIPIAVLCFWLGLYRYHVLNQELYTQFLWSPEFFLAHLTKSGGGLTNYLGLFIIQFFKYAWVGALFQTAGFIAIWYLTHRISGQLGILTNWKGVLLLPALTLLGLQTQYEFVYTETLKTIFYFALFYGYIRIYSPKIRLILSLACSPIILMLLGGGIFLLLYVLFFLFELCFASKRIPYLGMCGWLPLMLFLPQIYKLFHLASNASLYSIFPNIQEVNFAALTPLFFIWLPLFLLFGWGIKKLFPTIQPFRGRLSFLVNLVIVAAALWVLKEKCYYPKAELLFHADNAVVHEDWDEMLRIAKDYNGTRNSFIVLTNVALAQKGLLAENLFDYRQIGIDGLIHPWGSNYFNHLYGHEVYYRLGQMNAALRWIFEASVCKSESIPPRIAKRIVEILLELKKYDATREYLYMLAQTLSYKSWAKQVLRTLPGHSNIQVPSTTGQDFIIGSRGPFYDLVHMQKNDPENNTIRDYLLTGFLLEKSLPEFYTHFTQYFSPGLIRKLPKVYEEALIVVYQKGIDKDVLRKYSITQACMDRFQAYSDAAQTYGVSNPETPKLLTPRFENTYWFYYHFTPIKIAAASPTE